MKESHFFRQIKSGFDRKDETDTVTPITADEYEDVEKKPMTIKDHWLTLRRSIQEKTEPGGQTLDEHERTKFLSEVVTPELLVGYKQILHGFSERTEVSAEHPQRELIDIGSEEVSLEIETWIDNLISEVHARHEVGLDDNDVDELRAQCWIFFESVGDVMNTKSFEKDVTQYLNEKSPATLDEGEQKTQRAELVKNLEVRYQLDEAEAKILIQLVESSGDGEHYSPRVLVETIAQLWKEYKLEEKKGKIAKVSLGYLLSKGAESSAPSLFENMISDDKFNIAVFLEFFGLQKISAVIEAKTDIELAKVMYDINGQINERITNSLFFQEFEFIHEKSLGQIYATLERGKASTEALLSESVSQLVPTLSGIGMSLAFLTKINPALGAIGLASLPVMYKVAKKQNEKIWSMYERENMESEKIATHLGSIKSGFEEVRTSPDTPTVAHHVKEQLDTRDALSLQRFTEETKNSLKRMIPFDISTIAAAGVGGALQELGMISGGAVLSNIIYSAQLNRPVQELVNLYFNRFSRYIQDIQRMDEILGEYEKLDLPEGEKEKERISVSALESFDLTIRGLRYKHILHGVDLNVRQGEFLTVAGASGAGKSTLLRNIVGLYKPDGGSITIGGIPNTEIKKYGQESIYSAMSYCNQSPQFFEGMTLRENLLLWSKKDVEDARIKQVLRDLHLDTFVNWLDAEVQHLSGGEKVRLGVARTLIKGAKIMLLDEPTASLDSQSATEVRKLIRELHERYPDITTIAVTHDEELIKLSNRSVEL